MRGPVSQAPRELRPIICAGNRISVALIIIGVIASEFVASQEGMGYLISLSSGLRDTPLMIAAITMFRLTGPAAYGIIAGLKRGTVL